MPPLTFSQYLMLRRGGGGGGTAPVLDFTYPSQNSGPKPSPWPEPVNYMTALPFTPPTKPDRRFVRMDAWCVSVPGLPFVKGVASEHPDRLMTYVIQRYDKSWRQKCYDAHKAHKYTHWFLSLADMIVEDGMSVDQIVALAKEIRAQGFWISMWLGSKNYLQFIPQDQRAPVWKEKLTPYIIPMMEADCLHHAIVGGEFNLWNLGEPNEASAHDIAKTVVEMCKPYGTDVYFHFGTECTFWAGVPGVYPDRFAWWRAMCDLGVRGIYYQGDPSWKLNEFQGRIADTLGRVDERCDFISHEIMAIYQFTGQPTGADWPNEADGRMMGLGCLCTGPSSQVPNVQQWGYGNGAAYMNGEAV